MSSIFIDQFHLTPIFYVANSGRWRQVTKTAMAPSSPSPSSAEDSSTPSYISSSPSSTFPLLRYSTFFMELGDVLFTWSPTTRTSIPPKLLKKILSFHIWFEYKCGRLTEEACNSRVVMEFSFPPAEIEAAFSQARESLQSDNTMIASIRRLKKDSQGFLKVYATSNISLPDWEVLRMRPYSQHSNPCSVPGWQNGSAVPAAPSRWRCGS